MNKQTSRSNDEAPRSHPRQSGRNETRVAAIQGASLISQLVYAILIVGFVGYYMDKALQIIRQ